jgi:hypothetical protein
MLDDQNMNIEHWLNETDRESEVLQENRVTVPLWTLQIPSFYSLGEYFDWISRSDLGTFK